eukprot:6273949-Amphidinium_carterae.1
MLGLEHATSSGIGCSLSNFAMPELLVRCPDVLQVCCDQCSVNMSVVHYIHYKTEIPTLVLYDPSHLACADFWSSRQSTWLLKLMWLCLSEGWFRDGILKTNGKADDDTVASIRRQTKNSLHLACIL